MGSMHSSPWTVFSENTDPAQGKRGKKDEGRISGPGDEHGIDPPVHLPSQGSRLLFLFFAYSEREQENRNAPDSPSEWKHL